MNVSTIVIPTGQVRSQCIACINSTADDDKSTFELLINGGRGRFLRLVEETAEDNETPYLWLLPVCSFLGQSQKPAKNLFFFPRSLPSGSHLFIIFTVILQISGSYYPRLSFMGLFQQITQELDYHLYILQSQRIVQFSTIKMTHWSPLKCKEWWKVTELQFNYFSLFYFCTGSSFNILSF